MGDRSDYERVGGDEGLRQLVSAFVDRFFDDFVIGFLFTGKDRDRIVRHEVELAAAHLGGPRAYAGRPVGEVHQALKINNGHFRRRLAIVRYVLGEQGVDDEIVERWIAHDRALEPVITTGLDCLD